MHPLYEALEARKQKYDPKKELGDTGAYGAYKAISKKVTSLFEGTLYNTLQTTYVKTFFINTLFDIANLALYVVSIIDERSASQAPTEIAVGTAPFLGMDGNR